MATPETIGLAICGGCKRDADVKLNAGGFAYYHCGCGHSERTHNASSSQRFLKNRVKPVSFDPPEETAPAVTETKPQSRGLSFF